MALLKVKGTKITIGGLGGTGKGSVSELLADDLGYKLMSAGRYFRYFADEEGVPVAVIEERAKINPKYDRMVDERTQEYGLANNHFIFEGRLAWRFIDGIRILLTCGLEERVTRIAGRDSLSLESAMTATRHREEAAVKRYMKYYNISDITDPAYYDFVVDTTNITAVEATAKIIAFLKLKDMYHPLRKQ